MLFSSEIKKKVRNRFSKMISFEFLDRTFYFLHRLLDIQVDLLHVYLNLMSLFSLKNTITFFKFTTAIDIFEILI